MRKLILLLLFAIVSFGAKAQIETIKESVSLDVYTIVDEALKPILDTIVSTEKVRDYYRPGMMFTINFTPTGTFVITAIDIPFKNNDIGVVEYGNTMFLISGGKIDEHLLLKSTEKREIIFFTNSVYKDLKSGDNVHLISRQDGFSHWEYKYCCNRLELIEFVNTMVVLQPDGRYLLPNGTIATIQR